MSDNNWDLLLPSCSSDKGGQWCYVKNVGGYNWSACQDLHYSSRFSGRQWSYQACATPELHSYTCRHYFCQLNGNSDCGGNSNNVSPRRGGISFRWIPPDLCAFSSIILLYHYLLFWNVAVLKQVGLYRVTRYVFCILVPHSLPI